jgi:hypothetical protein
MEILELTAKRAIAKSIAQNEIVTIEGDDQAHMDLRAECDDCVDAPHYDPSGARVILTEYWGTDTYGNDWRVHVIGS